MKNIIISQSQTGGVDVTYLVDDLSEEQVIDHADKILPLGTLFAIGNSSSLPKNRTFRDAWEIDFSEIDTMIAGKVSAQRKLKLIKSQIKKQVEKIQDLYSKGKSEFDEQIKLETAHLNELEKQKINIEYDCNLIFQIERAKRD